MPNIPQYESPTIDIRPSETGVESFAAAGRRAGAFYNQAGESLAGLGREIGGAIKNAGDTYLNYLDHQQINAGADHGSRLWATLQDSWNQTSAGADPHDPSVAKKWREEQLEPALSQFTEGFTTEKSQDWANHFANTLRQHYFTTTEADMSRLATVAVSNTVHNIANNFSNTAIKDPSAVPAMLDQVDHSIDGVLSANPNIKGPDAAKVRLEVGQKIKEQIVKAGAFGSIMNGRDPEGAAAAWSKKYPDYVDGTETMQFARAAKTYARMNAAEDRQARVMKDYQDKQQFNSAADRLEVDTIPKKPGDPPILPDDYWDRVRKIGAMPGVDPGRLRGLIENGERITNKLGKPEPLAPISHATTIDLMTQMRDGKIADTTAIYKAYEDNKLNNADFNFLQAQFAEMKTPEGERLDKDRELFFKRYSVVIDPTMDQGDRLYRAEMDARQQEQALRAKGQDPHLVYDPRSEFFFGKPENIQRYKQPLQTQIQPSPAAAPERPKGFPADAQWDAARRYWYVMQDGKKFRVDAADKPGQQWPNIPSSQ